MGVKPGGPGSPPWTAAGARSLRALTQPKAEAHARRHRWGHEPGDPHYAADDAALNPAPVLSVPTLMLHGASDTCTIPDSSAGKEAFFKGPYRRELLAGVGHFPPREAPQAVAQALLDFLYSTPV
jgi:pimeloyl-ACP methyl ester carboxylesterase